jgi:hypothetical protein
MDAYKVSVNIGCFEYEVYVIAESLVDAHNTIFKRLPTFASERIKSGGHPLDSKADIIAIERVGFGVI